MAPVGPCRQSMSSSGLVSRYQLLSNIPAAWDVEAVRRTQAGSLTLTDCDKSTEAT